MEDLRTARRKGTTIISKQVDWWVFVFPLLAAAVAVVGHDLTAHYGWVVDDRLPAWAYAGIMVALDVGHTWTSFLLAHAAYGNNSPNRDVYWAVPMGVVGTLLLACVWDLAATWVAFGYASMLHYYMQQRRLYFLAKRWSWLEEVVLAIGCAGPIAIWHTDPTRDFDWFSDREDPLPFVLPELVYPVCILVMFGVAALYLAKVAVQGELNSFGTWFVASSWVSWLGGCLHHSHTSALLFLTIPHAVPCFVVSYYALKNHWAYGGVAPRSDLEKLSVHISSRPVHYLALLMLLACLEEGLWEVLVYREWSHTIFPHPESGPTTHAVITALLLVPQVCHVAYDFLVWDDKSNPGVGRLLAKADVYALL